MDAQVVPVPTNIIIIVLAMVLWGAGIIPVFVTSMIMQLMVQRETNTEASTTA